MSDWASNVDLIERIFTACIVVSKPLVFSQYMSVSSAYYNMGKRVMTKYKEEFQCKCKCIKMREFKIQDTIKRWHCLNCDYRIDDNCWKSSDYSRKVISSNVCKKCFQDHWENVMCRRLKLCIRKFIQ